MELNISSIKLLINNAVNAKLNKPQKDIKDVNNKVNNINNELIKIKKVTDLIVTDGDGTKFLSDDGTYKTLVIEDGEDVPENIALIVTQNQEAIKRLNGTGIGSVEYKIKEAFTVGEINK